MKTIVCFLVLVSFASPVIGQTVAGKSNEVTVSYKEDPADPAEAMTLASLGITKVPRYYALIVGVSHYQFSGAGLANLEEPSKDAESIYRILTEKYVFAPEDVVLLKNATREEIINQFDLLSNKVTEKDNLLVFYAGHGFYDKARDFGYWLPADAKTTSRSAWIANSTIKDYMGAIKSKHTLLITDACFGGSIFKTRSVAATLMRFNEMYRDKSRKAMTSGNLSEVPDKSVFLQFLIKNLEDNTELFLPSSSLFTRIYEPILNNAATTPQYGTIQGAGDEGGDFIFIKRN